MEIELAEDLRTEGYKVAEGNSNFIPCMFRKSDRAKIAVVWI
jgi:hypothetical protein